ncbi:MAG TPA: hypothetical protein VGG33_24695, partial [Polyangia bacterium]
EHEESGVHLVIETRARTVHKATEPAAVVSISGRLKALEPLPREAPEVYRARVEPLIKDTVAFEIARTQFQSFVTRLEEALRATMINAVVEEVRAEARLVKATPGKDLERGPVRDPAHPGYDPYLMYYPSPMGTMLDAMMIASFMSMLHPPMFHVMSPSGASLGNVQEAASGGGGDDDGGDREAGDDGGGDDGDGGDDGGGFDFGFGDD